MRFVILANLPMALSSIINIRRDMGINCRGSALCNPVIGFYASHHFISDFNTILNTGGMSSLPGGPILDGDQYFADDEFKPFIACEKIKHAGGAGVCLFLQGDLPIGTVNVNGSVIKARISDLKNHGCKGCGSVPLSGNNDPRAAGILTANYVQDTQGCNGVCVNFTMQSNQPSDNIVSK